MGKSSVSRWCPVLFATTPQIVTHSHCCVQNQSSRMLLLWVPSYSYLLFPKWNKKARDIFQHMLVPAGFYYLFHQFLYLKTFLSGWGRCWANSLCVPSSHRGQMNHSEISHSNMWDVLWWWWCFFLPPSFAYHTPTICPLLERGSYSMKGTPNLLKPFYNAGNSTIKFVNGGGASPAMPCFSYLLFSCHWYGA